MAAARVATLATIGAVLVWGVKALAIGVAGGLDKSPFEAPLFALGFLLFLVGVLAIAVAVTAGRGPGGRVLGFLATVVVFFVAWMAVDTLVVALTPEQHPHWVWAEVQLWVMSVLTALGWQAWLRRVPAAAAEARPV